MSDRRGPFTPVDVLRRVTAMGVIASPTTLWSYLRGRLREADPALADAATAGELPVGEETLAEWLDDFVDAVDAERSRLSRRLNPDANREA